MVSWSVWCWQVSRYVGPMLVIIGPTWTPCNLCTGSMASVTATWRGMPQGAYVSCRATIAMTTLFGWSSIIACCDVAEEMPATCWWWHGAATTGMDSSTLRPTRNGRRFADDTFKRIFLNENVRISIKISLKFVPKGPINNNPSLVQIMAWRR